MWSFATVSYTHLDVYKRQAWKHTPDEQKISKDFAFSEEGLDEIYEWLLGDGRKLIMES